MFDYKRIVAGLMDRVVIMTKLDIDPNISQKFRKRIKWIGYEALPFILQIATFIVFAWIINRIYLKVGFEKTVIISLYLIIISLRGRK